MRELTDAEKAAMPPMTVAVQVIAGYVWEHDVDAAGFATSPLRPHYWKGDPSYPKGGYPDPKDLRRLMAETSARELAAKK